MWSWARCGFLSARVSLYHWLRVADENCRGRRQTLPEAVSKDQDILSIISVQKDSFPMHTSRYWPMRLGCAAGIYRCSCSTTNNTRWGMLHGVSDPGCTGKHTSVLSALFQRLCMGNIACTFMGWRLHFLHSGKTLVKASESHLMGSLQLL